MTCMNKIFTRRICVLRLNLTDCITSDRNDWTGSDLPRSEKVRDLGKSDSVQSFQSDAIQKMYRNDASTDYEGGRPCIRRRDSCPQLLWH